MPDLSLETAARARGFRWVAGIDEAGRGPLAGPVAAAAVILPPGFICPGLDDSKKISAPRRERLYEILTTDPAIRWAVATADVEAPVAEKLLDIAGASTTSRVKNLTFQGITFQNTDYGLYTVAGSHGKATVQGATVYIAYGDGNWHNSKYEITDTLPGVINASNADSLEFTGNVVEHSGAEGISLINDVINSKLTGNYVTDIAGSGMTSPATIPPLMPAEIGCTFTGSRRR